MSEYPSTHPYRRDETRALTLDLSELGPRAATLLELCRHTRGRLTILDHDRPIARVVPLDTGQVKMRKAPGEPVDGQPAAGEPAGP